MREDSTPAPGPDRGSRTARRRTAAAPEAGAAAEPAVKPSGEPVEEPVEEPAAGPVEEPAAGVHRAVTVEQGRFCCARCDCGWRGPARRARSLARADAATHAADPPPEQPDGNTAT